MQLSFKVIFFILFCLILLGVLAIFGKTFDLTFVLGQKETIEAFIRQSFFLSLLIYAVIYIFIVAFSLPGALVMTLIGGLFFGGWRATPLIVFSATTGAGFVFLFAQYSKMDIAKLGSTAAQFKQGFAKNAFYYLLFLRLTPIFPFLLVNIAPALLGMKLRPFLISTALGITPATAIYATIGGALNHVNATNTLLSTEILLALTGLGLLALLPLMFKKKNKT